MALSLALLAPRAAAQFTYVIQSNYSASGLSLWSGTEATVINSSGFVGLQWNNSLSFGHIESSWVGDFGLQATVWTEGKIGYEWGFKSTSGEVALHIPNTVTLAYGDLNTKGSTISVSQDRSLLADQTDRIASTFSNAEFYVNQRFKIDLGIDATVAFFDSLHVNASISSVYNHLASSVGIPAGINPFDFTLPLVSYNKDNNRRIQVLGGLMGIADKNLDSGVTVPLNTSPFAIGTVVEYGNITAHTVHGLNARSGNASSVSNTQEEVIAIRANLLGLASLYMGLPVNPFQPKLSLGGPFVAELEIVSLDAGLSLGLKQDLALLTNSVLTLTSNVPVRYTLGNGATTDWVTTYSFFLPENGAGFDFVLADHQGTAETPLQIFPSVAVAPSLTTNLDLLFSPSFKLDILKLGLSAWGMGGGLGPVYSYTTTGDPLATVDLWSSLNQYGSLSQFSSPTRGIESLVNPDANARAFDVPQYQGVNISNSTGSANYAVSQVQGTLNITNSLFNNVANLALGGTVNFSGANNDAAMRGLDLGPTGVLRIDGGSELLVNGTVDEDGGYVTDANGRRVPGFIDANGVLAEGTFIIGGKLTYSGADISEIGANAAVRLTDSAAYSGTHFVNRPDPSSVVNDRDAFSHLANISGALWLDGASIATDQILTLDGSLVLRQGAGFTAAGLHASEGILDLGAGSTATFQNYFGPNNEGALTGLSFYLGGATGGAQVRYAGDPVIAIGTTLHLIGARPDGGYLRLTNTNQDALGQVAGIGVSSQLALLAGATQSTAANHFVNAGTLVIDGAASALTIAGDLNNAHLINVSAGTLTSNGFFNPGGLQLTNNATFNAGALTNVGANGLLDGGGIWNLGGRLNYTGHAVTGVAYGTTLKFDGPHGALRRSGAAPVFTLNAGTLTFAGGAANDSSSAAFTNTGLLQLTGAGSSFSVDGYTGNGTLQLGLGTNLDTTRSSGAASLPVDASGRLAPGSTWTIAGDLRYTGPALTGLAAGSSLVLARVSADRPLLDGSLNLDSGGDSFDRVDGGNTSSGLPAFSDLRGNLTLASLVTLSLADSLTVRSGASLTLDPRATLQVKGAGLTLEAGSTFTLGGGNLILGGGAHQTTLHAGSDLDLIAGAGGGEIQLGRVTYQSGAYTTTGSGGLDVDGTLTNSNYVVRGAGTIAADTIENYARIFAAGGTPASGTLTLLANTINNSGWLGSVGQGSLVIGDVHHDTTLNNAINLMDGTVPGLLDVQGRLTLLRTAVHGGGLTVSSTGALYIGDGSTLAVDTFTLNGDLDLAANNHLSLNGITTSADTDIQLHDGATLTLGSATPFTNNGNITLSNGAAILGTTIRNNGRYLFDVGSSSLTGLANLAGGVLAVDSSLTLLDSTFDNAGFIRLGAVAPSATPPTGTLRLAQDLTLTGGGFVQLGGLLGLANRVDASGNPYTELTVTWKDGAHTSGSGVITSVTGERHLTNVDNTIQGRGNLGDGLLTIVNAAGGTIRSLGSDIAGTLVIQPGSGGFRNLGTLSVDTGTTLHIDGTFHSVENGAFTEGAYVVGGTLLLPEIDSWFDAAVPITFNSTGARITDGTHDAGIRNITATGGLTISGNASYVRDTDLEPFTNQGRLAALFGGTIALTGSQFTNYDAGARTLTGGRFDIDASTLRFDGADIVTNAADIRLGGAYAFTNESAQSALRNFSTNAGRFELRNGADFTANAALPLFTNTGGIVVRAGSTLDLNQAAYSAGNASNASLWIAGAITSPVAPASFDHTHVTLYGPAASWNFAAATLPLLVGTGGKLTFAGGFEAHYAPGVTIQNNGIIEFGSPTTPTADGSSLRSSGFAMFGSGDSSSFATINGGLTRLYSGVTDDLSTASNSYQDGFWRGFYVDRLRINGDFDANGAVTVGPGGRFEINGVFSNSAGPSWFLQNGSGGFVTVTGGLDLSHAVHRDGVDLFFNYTAGSPIRLDGVNLVLTDIYPHYVNTGNVRLANGSSVRNAAGQNLLNFTNNSGTVEIANQNYTLSSFRFNEAGGTVVVSNGTLTTGGEFVNDGLLTGGSNGRFAAHGGAGNFTNRGTIEIPVSTSGDLTNETGASIAGSVNVGGEFTNAAGATFTGSGSAWGLVNRGTMELNLFNVHTDQPYVGAIFNAGTLSFRGSTFANLVPRAGSPGQYDSYSAFITNHRDGTLNLYGVVTASLWSEGSIHVNDPDGLAFDTRFTGSNFITGPIFVDSGRLHLTANDNLTTAASNIHSTITVASGAALQLDNLTLSNQVVLQDGALFDAGDTGSTLPAVYRDNGTPTIKGRLALATLGGSGGLTLQDGHLTITHTSATIDGDLAGLGTIGFGADNINPYLTLSGDSSLLAAFVDWSTPAITIAQNGILTFNGTTTQTVETPILNHGQIRVYSPELLYTGVISGNGTVDIGLEHAGGNPRSATFTRAQTYSGLTMIGANSSLTLAGNGSLAGSILNHGQLIFSRLDDFTLGAGTSISGEGSIVKNGTNTLTLTDRSYLNRLSVNDGALVIDANTFASGSLPSFTNRAATALLNADAQRSLSLAIDGTGTFQNFSAGDVTLSLTGQAGRLSHHGSGTLTLAAQSAFTPNDIVGGVFLGNYTAHPGSLVANNYTTPGTLVISSDAAFGAAPATPTANWLTIADGRTLRFAASTDLAATRGVAIGTGTIDVGSFMAGSFEIPHEANILAPLETIFAAGGNTLTKTGAGTLGLTTPSLAFHFNVLGGTLAINNPSNSFRTYQGLAVAQDATARFTGLGTAQLPIDGGTLAGNLAIEGGKLNISGSVANPDGTATITVASGATLWTYGSGALVYDRILGAGTYEGSYAADTTTIGTLHLGTFLANHGDYTVDHLVVSGTTSVHSAAASLAVGDGFTGTLTAIGLNVSGDFTVNTALSTGGTFTKTGAGTLLLDFSHTHFTNFAVQAGTLAATRTQTYSGDITGGGAFAVVNRGAGTQVTLTGANTYTGGTTVTSGRLILGDGTRLGSIVGNVHLTDASSGLAYNAPGEIIFDKTLTGPGYLQQAGPGTLVVNTDLTFSNDTVADTEPFDDNRNLAASAGTLRLDDGAAGIGKVTFTNASQLLLNNDADLTIAGAITGSGSVTKQNTGHATLAADNTHTGATAVNAGTLTLLGGNLNAGGTTISTGATLALTGTATLAGSITNAYSGTVSLSDTAALTGTLVNNGILSLNRDGDYTFAFTPTGSGIIEQNGDGDLTLASAAHSNALRINSGRAGFSRNEDLTFNSALGGAGRFFHTGDILRLSGGTFSRLGGIDIDSMSTIRLEGGSTYDTDFALAPVGRLVTALDLAYERAITGAGLMTIESGTFTLTGTAGLGTTGTIDLPGGRLTIADGGTLALRDRSLVTGNVTNHGLIDFDNLSNYTFAAQVDGTGSFLIDSSGRVEITAANTATGGATIAENSTLALSGNGAIAGTILNHGTLEVVTTSGASRIIPANIAGAGDFLLSGGGTIQISGDLAYSGDTRLSDGTTLDSFIHENETSTFSSTIYGTGNLMKSGAGTLVMVNNSAFNGDVTIMNGTLQIGNGGTTGYLYADTITVNGTLAYNVSAPNQIGSISGFGGIRQMGSGLLTIAADNPNLRGPTTVDAGRQLQIGNSAGDAGSVGGEIVAEGSLWLNRAGSFTHGGGLSGSGLFQKTLAGDLRLENNFNFAGQLTVGNGGLVTDGRAGSRLHHITATSLTNVATGNLLVTGNNALATTNAGRLTLGDGGTTGWLGNGTLANSGILEINRANDVTLGFGTSVTGFGVINQLGTGTLTIGPAVSASQLTVSNGTMALDSLFTGHEHLSINSEGAGTLALLGGTYDFGISIGGHLRIHADVTLNNASVTGGLELNGGSLFLPNVGVLTLNRTLAGYGTLRFGDDLAPGARWLNLNADNTHTGTIHIGSGPFGLANVAGDLASTLHFTEAGGTVNFINSGEATFTGGLVNVAAVNFNGTGHAILGASVAPAATLNAGTLTLASGGSLATLAVNHGTARLAGGTLASLSLGTAADAILDITAGDATLNRLSGGGSIALGDRTLTLAQSAETSYAGVISGAGGVAKNGAGSLRLEGDNTFTGTLAVTEGLLALRGTNTASAFVVESGGQLTLDHADNLGSAPASLNPSLITLRGGHLGTEASVALASTQGITLDGGGTLSATGMLTLNNQVAGHGTLTIGGGQVLFNTANTYAGPVVVHGTLALGHADAIDPLATTFANGSTFDVNGFNWSHDLGAQGVTITNGASTAATVSSQLTIDNGFGLGGNLTFTGLINAAGGAGSVGLWSNGNVRFDSPSGGLIGSLNVGSGNLSVDLHALTDLHQVNLNITGALTLTGAARDLAIGIGTANYGWDTLAFLNHTDGAIRLTTDLGLVEHDGLRRSVMLIGGESDLTLAGTIWGEASLTKVGSGNLTIESTTAGWNNANSGARLGIRDGTVTTSLALLNNRTLVFEGAGSHLAITDDVGSTYYVRSLLGDDTAAHLDLGARNVTFYQNTSGEYAGTISTTGELRLAFDPLRGPGGPPPDRQSFGTVNAGSFFVYYGDVTIDTALNSSNITVWDSLTTRFDGFTNHGTLSVETYAGNWSAQGDITNHGYTYVNQLANLSTTGAINNHDTFYLLDSTVGATAFNQNAGSFAAFGTLNAPLHVNGGVFDLGASMSTGTLAVRGGVTLAPGSITRWEFEPADGTAAAASADLLQITHSPDQTDGRLTFAPAAAKLPLMVQVGSSSFPYAANFTTSHSWTMATTTDGVAGFDPATVLVRPQPGFHLANAVSGQGNFGLQVVGQDLHVVYDPSTLISVGPNQVAALENPIGPSGTYGLGGLSKVGNGTLAIPFANTYTGHTQMLGGTLEIGHDQALGTGAVIWNSGTIRADTSARNLANTFYLQGNLTVGGAADLTLAGSLTNIADSNRTLTFNNTHRTTLGDVVMVASPTHNAPSSVMTFSVNAAAGGVTVSGQISEGLRAGALTKAGGGALVLAGDNTYTGATTINAGKLQLGDGGASGSVIGNIVNQAALVFNRSDVSTHANAISGTGTVSMEGTGVVTLAGHNTYAGQTTLARGTLAVAADSALGTHASVAFTGGALRATASFDTSRAATLGQGGGAFDVVGGATLGWNGAISGAAGNALTKLGEGTLVLGGVNTYAGDTRVNAGTLRLGTASAFSPQTALHVADGATFDANGFAQSFATLSGSGTLATGAADGPGIAIASAGNSTFDGAFSGHGQLTITGGGTLRLTGNSAGFAGTTSVTNATLRLDGSLAGSALTLGSGARLTGTGTAGTLALQSGATLAAGHSPGILRAGDTSFAGGARFELEINGASGDAGVSYDLLAITGALNFTATSADQFTLAVVSLDLANDAGQVADFDPATDHAFTFVTTTAGITGFSAEAFAIDTSAFTNPFNGSWSVSLANGGNALALTYTAAAIPEPSTYALLAGLAMLAVAILRRR